MKLKVIQALPALNSGGVERGTIELANELVSNGHHSIVISAGGRLVDELLQTGSQHITLPIGKKSPTTLSLIGKLRRIIKESEANILHARSRLPAWISYFAWQKMEKNLRPRFITSVHGPYTVNRYSKIMTQGERVIAISDFIQNYIGSNYSDVDMNKVSVIHRGISPNSFPYGYKPAQNWLDSWQQQHPELHNKFVITLPARITRWKGQQDFIDIIAKLIHSGLEVHGVIAGDAETRRMNFLKQLKSQIASLNLGKHISFVGHRDDLREVMSASNLVLSLAREPEAFGRTALEALALGIPVVAYDHGGASEVLKGIFPEGLVNALDKDAVVRKVREFITSPPTVSDEMPFTLSRMLRSTINLYQEIASQ